MAVYKVTANIAFKKKKKNITSALWIAVWPTSQEILNFKLYLQSILLLKAGRDNAETAGLWLGPFWFLDE